jgi:DNA-binding FrmR family transcriptional regulator
MQRNAMLLPAEDRARGGRKEKADEPLEGQIRGIQKMLENDAYCNDILVQSSAVSAAMNAFNKELLSSHIHSCVVRDIQEGKTEVVDELMNTLQKLMK